MALGFHDLLMDIRSEEATYLGLYLSQLQSCGFQQSDSKELGLTCHNTSDNRKKNPLRLTMMTVEIAILCAKRNGNVPKSKPLQSKSVSLIKVQTACESKAKFRLQQWNPSRKSNDGDLNSARYKANAHAVDSQEMLSDPNAIMAQSHRSLLHNARDPSSVLTTGSVFFSFHDHHHHVPSYCVKLAFLQCIVVGTSLSVRPRKLRF